MLLLKWKDLLLHAFDPAQAQASGLRVDWLHYGLLAVLSLTIVATLSAVGLILAIGLLIAPGAIAFLLVRSFGTMLVVVGRVCMALDAARHLSELLPRQRAGADHRADPDGAVRRGLRSPRRPDPRHVPRLDEVTCESGTKQEHFSLQPSQYLVDRT